MKDKYIGNFKVNPIGIGTWMMGGGWYADAKVPYSNYENDNIEIDSIKYSINKGQNHIDGAELYGAGHTDELIGQAIKDFNRSKLFVASKIHRSHALRISIVPTTIDILRKMQTQYLDLLYIHAPFPEIPIKEYILGLNDTVDSGIVRNIGVSNFNIDQLKEAISISQSPIVANQIRYNVLYKTEADSEMIEFCKKNNTMIVTYRPVERKLLADNTTNQTVLKISKKYNKTPAQIALNWLVMQDNVVSVPKASSKQHIDENLDALSFEIESDDIEELNQITSIS